MSIILSVTTLEGNVETIGVVGQYTALKWGQLGKELGLKLLSEFPMFLELDHKIISELLAEMLTLRVTLEKVPEGEKHLEAIDRFIRNLEKLQHSKWQEASVG